MATTSKKRKSKLSNSELLDLIVDKEELEARKIAAKAEKEAAEEEKKKNSTIDKNKEKTKEIPWFKKKLDKNKFTVISQNKAFYGHYEYWKPNVFIGPYKSQEEAENAIYAYLKEVNTKKNPMDRKLKDIHSVILKTK